MLVGGVGAFGCEFVDEHVSCAAVDGDREVALPSEVRAVEGISQVPVSVDFEASGALDPVAVLGEDGDGLGRLGWLGCRGFGDRAGRAGDINGRRRDAGGVLVALGGGTDDGYDDDQGDEHAEEGGAADH